MLYFDESATTKPSDYSLEVFNYISKEFWGNPSSTSYQPGIEAKRKLEEARKIIAEQIGADPSQIFFTSGSTEGANWIIRHTPMTEAIITTETEHPAVYNSARWMQNEKTLPLHSVKVSQDGLVDMDELSYTISLFADLPRRPDDQTMVVITDSNNETGVIQPTKEIADLCHNYKNVRLFADMTQSFAHSDVFKVDDLGYDFAIASAQKFHAPRGAGFIYVRHPEDIEAMLLGGHQEANLRAGTEPVALIYAMAAQFQHEAHIRTEKNIILRRLKDYLIGRLYARIGSQFRLNVSDKVNALPDILSIRFDGYDANKLLSYLALDEIYLSAGSACSTGENKPSRILKAMGLTDEQAKGTIRITLSDEHSHADVDKLVNHIATDLNFCKI